MKIAVVGGGISGSGCAWLLQQNHDVTLYEAEDRFGGHAHTVEVPGATGRVVVDTGFIVYNDVNYPNLIKLFDYLGVETKPSIMSFAVSLDDGRLEYSGGSLVGLFGQRRNLVSPKFYRMLGDLLRFYRKAPALLDCPKADEPTLGAYLAREKYSDGFVQNHILPMGAAIWSCPLERMLEFPAASFIRFCVNHGLLKLLGRPNWRTVTGGSREYVRRLNAPLLGKAKLATPVQSVRRVVSGVEVVDANGGSAIYDQVVLACHGDDAARIVAADRPDAAAVLSSFRYQENRAVLHHDAQLLPKRRRLWSSWNYSARSVQLDQSQLDQSQLDQSQFDQSQGGECLNEAASVSVTYWMNLLQSLPGPDLFVTLNPIVEPRPELIEREFFYNHPVFDHAAISAQRRLPELQGKGGLWFCGSYCGWGFHEDGFTAGIDVATALGCPPPWTVSPVRRAQPRPYLEPALA